MNEDKSCPDCGCLASQHNAVNRVPEGLVAHCGGCGSCWTTLNAPFVEEVRAAIELADKVREK